MGRACARNTISIYSERNHLARSPIRISRRRPRTSTRNGYNVINARCTDRRLFLRASEPFSHVEGGGVWNSRPVHERPSRIFLIRIHRSTDISIHDRFADSTRDYETCPRVEFVTCARSVRNRPGASAAFKVVLFKYSKVSSNLAKTDLGRTCSRSGLPSCIKVGRKRIQYASKRRRNTIRGMLLHKPNSKYSKYQHDAYDTVPNG